MKKIILFLLTVFLFQATWAQVTKKSYDEALNFLTKEMFENQNNKTISAFAEKLKKEDKFSGFINETKKILSKTLKDEGKSRVQNKSEVNGPPTTQSIPPNTVSAEQDRRNESWFSWFSGITPQIIVISLLFAIILFIILYIKIIKVNQRIENNQNKRHQLEQQVRQQRASSRSTSQPKELDSIQEKLNHLEADIKNLNERINGLSKPSEPGNNGTNPETEPPQPKQDIFYLSNPNSDGSFNKSSASSSYREGASIYKFTKRKGRQATFQIDERRKSIQLAIKNPDSNIDPVCNAENAFNANPSKITTTQPGKAELQNEKWIVTQKAEIRYE